MYIAGGTAQCLCQADRQLTKPGESHAAAKANDGRLAGAALARDLREGGVGGQPRMSKNPVGDAPFCAAEGRSLLFDTVKHVVKLQKIVCKCQKYCKSQAIL